MLKSHERFYSSNGKRLVLVVDDEFVNREMLGNMLAGDYEVLYAIHGQDALEIAKEYENKLSLILLDLLMPIMDGLTLLRRLKETPELSHIPVIVLTSETSAEVECLRLGASDFIRKPYDMPEIVMARVQRTIMLAEETYIIKTTEHDELTGLYSREYFYSYAAQYDHHHPDTRLDAVMIDINHFHLINELYGRGFGDEVLKKVANSIHECISGGDGIACRLEADRFLIYWPHTEDYDTLAHAISENLSDISEDARVRIRIGVYADVDREIAVERRFDRAKRAGDTIRNNFLKTTAFYDNVLHERAIRAEKLTDDMDRALKERQFRIFYQPKFEILGERPRLKSAEALIRWDHPQFGTLGPGAFIPLFEKNGLVQRLDHYVWEAAAAQVEAWKDAYGVSVPVSVNVSRVDMYDADLPGHFTGLVNRHGLDPKELCLEITESAYTEDTDQIISMVDRLRAAGFSVEMDDFGAGYSSLNMLSELAIDVLKLDMKFVQNIHKDRQKDRLVALMLDIAEYLHVPVVAEGVETREQLGALREMGCDMVQGYYFSRPVPAAEFTRFITDTNAVY